MTDSTSSPFTAISLAALSSELSKIAAESEARGKPHWGEVAKNILGVGIGAGLGTGAAMLVERSLPKVFSERHPKLAPAMKIILPIMGATTSYLGQKLRHRTHETYKKVPGYPEEEK